MKTVSGNMEKLERCSVCKEDVPQNEGFWIKTDDSEKFVCYNCKEVIH
jgi:hypothetical protein